MKILKHTLVWLSFGLLIVLTGLGYFYWGVAAFLLAFAWCQQEGKGARISDLESIDKMDGFEFERLVGAIYEKLGYRVKVTQEQGDFGADVIVQKGTDRVAIQCKRYKDKVGIDSVYQTLGGMKYYGCNKGLVITNSTFTAAALELARRSGIEMIDRGELNKLLKMVENRNLLEG